MSAQKIIWWVRELLIRTENIEDINTILVEMLSEANNIIMRSKE